MKLSPLLVVDTNYRLFDINGQELGQNFAPNDLFLALREDKPSPKSVQHALKYQTRNLHDRAEREHEFYGKVPPHRAEGEQTAKFPEIAPELNTHFAADPSGSEARRAIVQRHVASRIEAIEKAHLSASYPPGLPKFAHKVSEEKLELYLDYLTTNHDRAVQKTFRKLPEWMQILTGHIGGVVLLDIHDPYYDKANGGALSSTDNLLLPEPFTIKLDPSLLTPGVKMENAAEHTLREEILHQLHVRFDRRATFKDAAARSASDDDYWDFDINLDIRLEEAARNLMERFKKNPEHDPALALMRKSESSGGTLMSGDKDVHIESELLVDLFDAEIYLRRERKLGRPETESQLRHAFGDELYDIGREYLKAWIAEAAALKKQSLGPEAVARCEQKWLDDPWEAVSRARANHPGGRG